MSAPKVPPEGWLKYCRPDLSTHSVLWLSTERVHPTDVPCRVIPADGGDWVRRGEYEKLKVKFDAADAALAREVRENRRLQAKSIVVENEWLRGEIDDILLSVAGGWTPTVDEVLARLAALADSQGAGP